MAECTPGPWQAEQITIHSAPNERPWVGRLSEGRFAALSCGDTQEEAIANARLIAAAPDLLAALQTLVSQRDGHFHTIAAWVAARAAIAAACGEVGHG